MKFSSAIQFRALCSMGTLALAALPLAAQTTARVALEWPRVIVRNGVTNTIYQPQLESWDYITFKAESAVAIQPTGAPQPTFGTINLEARTRVDRAQREV